MTNNPNIEDDFIPSELDNFIEPEITKEEKDEYEEILQDIRLIIHEVIDKINDNANDTLQEMLHDIYARIDLESDGHNLNKDLFKFMISELADSLVDIYADEDDKPRSSADYFKYATTKAVKDKVTKELPI